MATIDNGVPVSIKNYKPCKVFGPDFLLGKRVGPPKVVINGHEATHGKSLRDPPKVGHTN